MESLFIGEYSHYSIVCRNRFVKDYSRLALPLSSFFSERRIDEVLSMVWVLETEGRMLERRDDGCELSCEERD